MQNKVNPLLQQVQTSLREPQKSEHLLLLSHRNNKWWMKVRSYNLASTFLIILSGLLLYTENFIGLTNSLGITFVNLEQSVPIFGILKIAIFTFCSALSPILIICAVVFSEPYKPAFIVPIYGWFNVLIGYIALIQGFDISNIWWFRLVILGFCVLLILILAIISAYYNGAKTLDFLKDQFIEVNTKAKDGNI